MTAILSTFAWAEPRRMISTECSLHDDSLLLSPSQSPRQLVFTFLVALSRPLHTDALLFSSLRQHILENPSSAILQETQQSL